MLNQTVGELTRCFLYARKSTESDERQVQSIDDQIRVMKERALSFGITIVDVLVECKSAKEPQIRNQFYVMLDRIRR